MLKQAFTWAAKDPVFADARRERLATVNRPEFSGGSTLGKNGAHKRANQVSP